MLNIPWPICCYYSNAHEYRIPENKLSICLGVEYFVRIFLLFFMSLLENVFNFQKIENIFRKNCLFSSVWLCSWKCSKNHFVFGSYENHKLSYILYTYKITYINTEKLQSTLKINTIKIKLLKITLIRKRVHKKKI